MDVTAIQGARRRRFRRLPGGGASPSLRAALFLALSTFLCGSVMAGLLFVGIWRHTASEAAHTQAVQQRDRQQLLATQRTLAGLKVELARDQLALGQARRRLARATSALVHARHVNGALTRSLSPSLQALVQTGATLARQTATIESELTALETYAQHPGAAGLDAGYLASQIRYLVGSAAAAASAAAVLVRHTQDAQAAFSTEAKPASD